MSRISKTLREEFERLKEEYRMDIRQDSYDRMQHAMHRLHEMEQYEKEKWEKHMEDDWTKRAVWFEGFFEDHELKKERKRIEQLYEKLL